MHFARLFAVIFMIISGSVVAADLSVSSPITSSTKIYQQGAASASHPTVIAEQGGVNNSLSVVQNVSNASVDIRQDMGTSDSNITVRQSGQDPDISFSSTRAVYVQQSGAVGSSVNIVQEAASTAWVSQTGSQNTVNIVQR